MSSEATEATTTSLTIIHHGRWLLFEPVPCLGLCVSLDSALVRILSWKPRLKVFMICKKKVYGVGGGWQEPAKVVSVEVTVTLLSQLYEGPGASSVLPRYMLWGL